MLRLIAFVTVVLALGAACAPVPAKSTGARPDMRTPPGPLAVAQADPRGIITPGIARDSTGTVTLAAVGDVMLDRVPGQRLLADGPGVVFAAVLDALAADITVGNLECAVSERGEPASKAYTFRAPPLAADALGSAGFDVVSLANNHAFDWGADALADTRDYLAARKIAAVGAGADAATARRPAILLREGLRIAFLGYLDAPAEGSFSRDHWNATETNAGVAWLDTAAMVNDIAAARHAADLVVVMLHFGFEGTFSPSERQRAQAHAAIDAGATLVLGSHPHVLQPVEEYGGGLIVYSLGNFVFDGFDGASNDTAIFRATLSASGVDSWSLIPAAIDGYGFPYLAD